LPDRDGGEDEDANKDTQGNDDMPIQVENVATLARGKSDSWHHAPHFHLAGTGGRGWGVALLGEGGHTKLEHRET